MARAREPTFSECLFTVLLFALIHTIAAKDVAPVLRYEERSGPEVVVNIVPGAVRVRRQVAATTTVPTVNGTDTVSNQGNDTAQNETAVTSAPTMSASTMPTPIPTTPTTTPSDKNSTGPITTRRPSLPANTTVIENDVKYYTIRTYREMTITQKKYWADLSQAGDVHPTLSDGHRLAQTVPLKFDFRFYGHTITNVTIATGGFLYMSPFLHKFLTATQYIAPLMANFDTSLGNESHIRYLSSGQSLVVQWENVHLQDQVEYGTFNFQVHLKQSGDIVFVYKDVPVSVSKIMEENHPVKIGLSDAFYIDKDDRKLGMKRRTIYEYHRVSINFTQVTSNTVVILKPNPTCNTARTCGKCLKNNDNMGCRWCGVVQRCSDGIDWNRQDWLDKGCKYLSTRNTSLCGIILMPTTTTTTAASSSTTTGCSFLKSGNANCSAIVTVQPTQKPLTKKDSGYGFPPGAVIAIILLVALIIGVGGWFFYAYRNPTSPSGMWLMEHRPDAMKTKLAKMKFWKQSTPTGDKYAVESEA